MSNDYQPIIRMLLRRCPVCAATTDDPDSHTAWHERLRDALRNGPPVVDPVDLDR
ncbi:hypothetical protein [uncultured Jatrophihabitans sp.]|uniref:hypothetical protein n=1 Tax=uncultured Jatrophihabitans sp. TaxID=1610747 RepID=UPI0035CBCAC6